MSEWQSIETAPKDETVVLVYPRDGAPQLAFYKTPWYHKYLLPAYKHAGSMWMTVLPLYESDCRVSNYPVTYCEYKPLTHNRKPTHWIPLPEPPK